VDADGRQQFGPKTAGAEEAQYEQLLTNKLLATLMPVAGEDNVRASVTADFDSGSEDDVDEVYDPTKVAPLSTDHTEASSGAQPAPGGVPGTASNAPNAKPVYPQQTTPPQNSKREQDSYAVSKAVHHHMQGPGRLRRVTAAILINDRMVRSADGKHVTWVARTPAEMHEIEQLAQAAVGIDASRGDQLTVQNLAFATNANPATAGLATRLVDHVGDNMGFVRYGVLFAVFLMVLIFIVRPVLAQIKQLSSSVQTMSAGGQAPQLKSASGAAHLDQTEELSFERQQARAQVLFDHVSEYVRKEPQQGTRLLQSWVRSAHKS